MRPTNILGVATLALVAAVVLLYPVVVSSEYYLAIGFTTLIYVTLGESWVLSSGFTGYASFGQAVFFGIGGYGVATAIQHLHWALGAKIFVGILAGAAAAVAFAIGLAWITLRVRAVYFSLLTLISLFLFTALASQLTGFTGGEEGIFFPLVHLSPEATALMWYYVACGLALTAVGMVFVFQRTGAYRRVLAMRDDEVAAESSGVATLSVKLGLFAVGAGLAAIAGSINFYQQLFIEPAGAFSVTVTAYAILMPVLGGTRTWAGPVVGALIIQTISTLLTNYHADQWDNVVFGVFLAASIVLFRDGLVGAGGRGVTRVIVRRRVRLEAQR